MQDWLNLKSVINVDSAFCCHSHRNKFTELVRSDEYFVCDQVKIEKESKILKVLHRFGKKLRSVVLASKLSSKQRRSIVKRCRNLTHVRLLHYGAYGPALWKILTSNLIMLDLSATYLDTPAMLSIAQFCSSVRTLGLARTYLWDDTLSAFTEACPHVLHLNIPHNHGLTDSGILTTVVSLKSLRALNIKDNVGLTDASLVHIYTHCASTLHTLHINCRDVSYTGGRIVPAFSVDTICELLTRCTHLRTFHIAGYVPPEGVPIQIPSTALCNITTLILEGSVCIVNTDEGSEFCANVHTLITDVLYKPALLAQAFIRCYNLRETHLSVSGCDVECFAGLLPFAEALIELLKSFRPEVVVQCVHTSEDYSEYDVMRM